MRNLSAPSGGFARCTPRNSRHGVKASKRRSDLPFRFLTASKMADWYRNNRAGWLAARSPSYRSLIAMFSE